MLFFVFAQWVAAETVRVRVVDFGQNNCRGYEDVNLRRDRASGGTGWLDTSSLQYHELISGVEVDGDSGTADSVICQRFTLTEPHSPRVPRWDSSWVSSTFYGGFSFFRGNRTGTSGVTEQQVNANEGDELMKPANNWALHHLEAVAGTTLKGHASWIWKKDGFLHGGKDGTVSFDANSLLALNIQRYLFGWEGVRFVVKDSGQFYLSESIAPDLREANGGTGEYQMIVKNPAAIAWGAWNPVEGGYENAFVESGMQLRNFQNIEAIGWYIYKDTLSEEQVAVKWESFECFANVTRPDSISEVLPMKAVGAGSADGQSVPAFYIGETEVSYQQWKAIFRWSESIGQWAYDPPGMIYDKKGDMGSMRYRDNSHTHSEPVTNFTLYDALAWCNALSEYEGKEPVYYTTPGFDAGTVYRYTMQSPYWKTPYVKPTVYAKWAADGYRLPTEAEWKVALAGEAAGEANAWTSVNSEGSTHPVGTKTANANGVKDMVGNAWEMVWGYGDSVAPDPASVAVMGGGFNFTGAADHLAQFRYPHGLKPYYGSPHIGLRIVRRAASSDVPGNTPVSDLGNLRWQIAKTDTTASSTLDALSVPTVLLPEGHTEVAINGETVAATITPLHMAKFETTFQQWKTVCDWAVANGYTFDRAGDMGSMDFRMETAVHSPDEPVTNITLYDMMAWCNALSEMEGKTPIYYSDAGKTQVYKKAWRYRPAQMRNGDYVTKGMEPGSNYVYGTNDVPGRKVWMKWDADGYRLPSRAEWCYAYNGGAHTVYPWGDAIGGLASGIGQYAWYKDNSGDRTHAVGQKSPNGFGLYDMAGNIVEYLADSNLKGAFERSWQTTNPLLGFLPNDFSSKVRAIYSKNGFLSYFERSFRTTMAEELESWGGADHGWHWPDTGFRVAWSPPGSYHTDGWDPAFAAKDASPLTKDLSKIEDMQGLVYRGNLKRDGTYPVTGVTQNPSLRWAADLGAAVKASPLLANGLVYVGATDGKFYAINETTGATVWNYQTGGAIYASACVFGGKAFFVSNDRYLYCANALTGEIIWKNLLTPDLNRIFCGAPTVAYGMVFLSPGTVGSLGVRAWGGKPMVGFDLETGEKVWQEAAGKSGPGMFSVPAISGGKMYFDSGSGMTTARLDLATGVFDWEIKTNITSGSGYNSMVFAGDRILSVCPFTGDQYGNYPSAGAQVLREDGSTTSGEVGGRFWTVFPYDQFKPGPPYVPLDDSDHAIFNAPVLFDGKVYLGSSDGTFHSLALADGARGWTFAAGEKIYSSAVCSSLNRTLYFGCDSGKVFALDADTGAKRWEYVTAGKVFSTPYPADGVLYFGSDDGKLYALEESVAPGSPLPVGNLSAVPGNTQVSLSWQKPDFVGMSGVLVLSKAASAVTAAPVNGTTYTEGQMIGDATVEFFGDAQSFLDTGLTNDTARYYRVFTYNTAKVYSAGVSAQATPVLDITAPKDVDSLAIAATGGKLAFSWTNPKNTDFVGSLVLVSTDGPVVDHPQAGSTYLTGQTLGGARVAYVGAAAAANLAGLANGANYYYKVYTYDASMNYSDGVSGSAIPALASGEVTVVDIGDEVRRSGLIPFGVNLANDTYYGSPMKKKRVEVNFEGTSYRQCYKGFLFKDGLATPWTVLPTSAWHSFIPGMAFTVISGEAKGQTGTIAAVETRIVPSFSPTVPMTFLRFSSDLTLAQEGVNDMGIFLERASLEEGTMVFPTCGYVGSVSIGHAGKDPATFGYSYAVLDGSASPTTKAGLSLKTAYQSLYDCNGTWKVRFRARKAPSSSPTFEIKGKYGATSAGAQPVALTDAWAQYECTVVMSGIPTTNPAGDPSQDTTTTIALDAKGGIVWIDDVECWKEGDTNPTPFNDQTVAALQETKAGAVRCLQMGGNTVENFIRPLLQSFSYTNDLTKIPGPGGTAADQDSFSLHELLQLCDYLGIELYANIPGTVKAEESDLLIDYLAAPVSSGRAGALLRQELGREAPWTDTVKGIDIEIGNEAWNIMFAFKAGGFNGPDYWQDFFSRAKANPYFNSKIRMTAGGQNFSASMAQEILTNTPAADRYAIAPYIIHEVSQSQFDEFLDRDARYRWMMAYPLDTTFVSGMPAQGQVMAEKGVEFSIYEINHHMTGGNASLDTVNEMLVSLPAGVSVANTMLLMMREYNIRMQCLFRWQQPVYNSTELGGDVRLWGALMTTRPDFPRYRPTGLAYKVVNGAIKEEMLSTSHSGSVSEFLAKGLFYGGAQKTVQHPCLYSYAFRGGNQKQLRSLLLVNLDTENAQPARIQFGGKVKGLATKRVLTAPDLASSNEMEIPSAQVSIAETQISLASGTEISVPPCSVIALTWEIEMDVSIAADATEGLNSLTANFSASVQGASAQDLYFQWDFDNDGIIDAEGQGLVNGSFHYAHAGNYTVRVLLSDGLGTTYEKIFPAEVTVLPYLKKAGAWTPTSVLLRFEDAVDAATANDPANYALDAGASVAAAARDADDPAKVWLTLASPMVEETLYTVAVDGVKDKNGAPIDATAGFVFRNNERALLGKFRMEETKGAVLGNGGIMDDAAVVDFSLPLAKQVLGKMGKGLDTSMDGLNATGYVRFGKGAAWGLVPSKPFTVSVWFKTGDTAGMLIGTGGSTNADSQFALKVASGKIYGIVGGVNASINQTVTDNAWHMATLVNDPVTGKARVYLDGSQVFSEFVPGAFVSSSCDMLAGANWTDLVANTGITNDLDGALDEVRVFGRAFTPAEVAELYSLTESAVTIVLDQTSVSVGEGRSGIFKMRLSDQPPASVSVSVRRASGSASLTVQSEPAVTFGLGDWSTWRTVQIGAAEDDENTVLETAVIEVAAVGLPTRSVSATSADDDLSVTISASGEGSVSPSGSFLVDRDDLPLSISATPLGDATFGSWIGDTSTVAAPLSASTTISPESAVSLQAYFIPSAPAPVGYQNTVASGYSGCVDTYLNSGAADTNYATATTISLRNANRTGLVKFDFPVGYGAGKIPPNAVVVDASLTVCRSAEYTAAGTASVFAMAQDWDVATATANKATASVNWTAPLAEGIDTDRKNTMLSPSPVPLAGVANSEMVFAMNPSGRAYIQSWIQNAANNKGFFLSSSSVTSIALHSNQAATESYRPKLVVRYVLPAFFDAQEIAVSRSGGTIANGATDFIAGTVVGRGSSLPYTVANAGTQAALSLGVPIVPSGLQNCSVQVVAQPAAEVDYGGTTTLQVSVTPSAPGAWSFALAVPSNDPQTPSYAWTVSGTSVSQPEIAITGNSATIPSGSVSPSAGNHTIFADTNVGENSVRRFTITNSGGYALALSGTPAVSVTGANASDFAVISQLASPLAAGASVSFDLRFSPSYTGTRSATVTVLSDDADEGAYSFAVQGLGVGVDQSVTNGNDDGAGSLRAALAAVQDGGTVGIPAGVTQILLSSPITVAKNVNIIGAGSGVTRIGGGDATQLLRVSNGSTGLLSVLVQGVAFHNAKNTAADVEVMGGAIFNEENLRLVDVIVQDSVVSVTAPTVTRRASGGGIYHKTGTLTMEHCAVLRNAATGTDGVGTVNGEGGGICVFRGAIAMTDCEISENIAKSSGGGMSATDISVSATGERCVISGNDAGSSGAGIYLTLKDTGVSVWNACEFSGNEATSPLSPAYGGGMYCNAVTAATAQLDLFNSTVSGNRVTTGNIKNAQGGGVYLASTGSLTTRIVHSTVAKNQVISDKPSNADCGGVYLAAGSLHLRSSITADNLAGDTTTGLDLLVVSGASFAGDSSLVEDGNGGHGAVNGTNGNIVGIDPQLQPLAANEGTTWSHALAQTSPAINAGNNPLNFTSDQRGGYYQRVFGVSADMGSFEYGAGAYARWLVAQSLAGAEREPTADADADGLPNLLEYALASNPKAVRLSHLPFAAVENENGDAYVALHFRKNKEANDVSYIVQSSTTLAVGDWVVEAATPVLVSSDADGDGKTEAWKVRVLVPVSEKRKFVRLKVLR